MEYGRGFLHGIWMRSCVAGIMVMVMMMTPVRATQEMKIVPGDPVTDNQFGRSVAMSGNYFIVGCPEDDSAAGRAGSAYIFKWVTDQWVQEMKLTAPDAQSGAQFGFSVSISSGYALVGAFRDKANGNQAGAAYLWRLNGDSWEYVTKLTPTTPQPGSEFGNFVKVYDDYAVIGAHLYEHVGNTAGAAYVFERNGTTFIQDALLVEPGLFPGSRYGTSAAMYGNNVIVGAPMDYPGSYRSGAAYVYEHDGMTWTFDQRLTTTYDDDNDAFGQSVDIWQGHALVGASGDNGSASSSGAAYLFKYNDGNWVIGYRLVPTIPQTDIGFGWSVAMNDNYAVIGAPWYDKDSFENAGIVYVYAYDGTFWQERMNLSASDPGSNAMLGFSVTVQDNETVVGAYGSLHEQAYCGAAYWFQDFTATVPTPTPTPSAVTYDIDLIDTVLAEGDIFELRRACYNPFESIMVDEYILLDIYEQFWFWPSWSETVDYNTWELPEGIEYDEVLLTFPWPMVDGTVEGLKFWGAFLSSGTTDLIVYDMVEWGYSNK